MKKVVIGALATIMIPASANAATIVNGSFENGVTVSSGGFVSLASGSTAITGWVVGGPGGVDYINGYWNAADGTHSIDLSGNGLGSISQTFDTVIGQTYNVSFALAGNPDAGPGAKTLLTLASGGTQQTNVFNVGSANTRGNMGWQTFGYSFSANSTQTTLSFSSATDSSFGPALDNVSISAVPEPATWAMMIGGFGLVGGALRRRRAPTLATA